jgi:hypothetical protein
MLGLERFKFVDGALDAPRPAKPPDEFPAAPAPAAPPKNGTPRLDDSAAAPLQLKFTLSFLRQTMEPNSRNSLERPAGSRRSTMKVLAALLVLGVAVGTGASANAKGCIKGAIVGGVAGHMAGHGAAGAAAGCVIGHHEASKHQNANQNR